MRPALFQIANIFCDTMFRIAIVVHNLQANAIMVAIVNHIT